MDAFSEILTSAKLSGAVFFTAEFSAPWGFSTPASTIMAAKVAPAAAHLVLYHLLVEGTGLVEMTDGASVTLVPGDIVVFPHGDPHHMSSGQTMRPPFPNYGITAKIKARDLSPLRAGGGGAVSRFVCGYMTCNPRIQSCVQARVRPTPSQVPERPPKLERARIARGSVAVPPLRRRGRPRVDAVTAEPERLRSPSRRSCRATTGFRRGRRPCRPC